MIEWKKGEERQRIKGDKERERGEERGERVEEREESGREERGKRGEEGNLVLVTQINDHMPFAEFTNSTSCSV